MPTRVPLLFGTMTFGQRGASGVRTTNLEECQKILDVYFSHGHRELDTARAYGDGTTEEYLAKLNLRNATIDTKVLTVRRGDHEAINLRRIFEGSLAVLKVDRVRALYLHAPDRTVPFEETLSEVDKLHKEGRFEIFGLSNYTAWEVAEIVGICQRFNYIQPKIYQAMYNPITRGIETELVPCLRKFGIRLVIFNPLAGGLLAGHIYTKEDKVTKGSRFDGATKQGKCYRERYFRDEYFDALEVLRDAAENAGMRVSEIALRWCQHHSILTPEDGIILGCSTAEQLEQNCADSEKGPLPEEVIVAIEKANRIVGTRCPPYWL